MRHDLVVVLISDLDWNNDDCVLAVMIGSCMFVIVPNMLSLIRQCK